MLVLFGLGFSWAFPTKNDTHWTRLSGIWESGVFDRYIPRYITPVGRSCWPRPLLISA